MPSEVKKISPNKLVGYIVLDEQGFPVTEDLFQDLGKAREYVDIPHYRTKEWTICQVRAIESRNVPEYEGPKVSSG